MNHMNVFVVQHVHAVDEDRDDMKMIGVYASEASARAAVERLSVQPGFCEAPDGFHVERYELDQDHWADGFVAMPR
jgi:hypothetical protein